MSSVRHARLEKALIELTYPRLQERLDRLGAAYDAAVLALQDADLELRAARAQTDRWREYVCGIERDSDPDEALTAEIVDAAYKAFACAVCAEQEAADARDDAELAVRAARRIFVQVFDFEP